MGFYLSYRNAISDSVLKALVTYLMHYLKSKVSIKNVLELHLVLKYDGDRKLLFFFLIIFYPFKMDVCVCLSKNCFKSQFLYFYSVLVEMKRQEKKGSLVTLAHCHICLLLFSLPREEKCQKTTLCSHV